MGVEQPGGVNVPTAEPSPAGQYLSYYDPSIDFKRDEFTAVLHQKGYEITWEKVIDCPDRTGLAPGEHNVSCDLCDGLGLIYFDPIDTRMLITGAKITETYYAYGRWDGGNVQVTALPEYQISYWDRLTLKHSSVRFKELVYRNKTTLFDRLKYAPLSVLAVMWRNATGALVTFASSAYQITNGQIEWLTTTRPAPGDAYVIAYTYRPRYTVLDLLHQHRDSHVNGVNVVFPVQAIAKLDFLIRDEGKDAREIEDQSPFSNR